MHACLHGQCILADVRSCPARSLLPLLRVLALQAPGRACPVPRDLLWPWPGSCSPDVPTARSSSRQAGASGLGLRELRGRDLWLWLSPTSLVTGDHNRPPSRLYPRTVRSPTLPLCPSHRIKSEPLPSLRPLPTTHNCISCPCLSLISHEVSFPKVTGSYPRAFALAVPLAQNTHSDLYKNYHFSSLRLNATSSEGTLEPPIGYSLSFTFSGPNYS